MYEKLPNCEVCDMTRVAFPGARLCAGCWEVESHISNYVFTTEGRNRLNVVLEKIGLQLTEKPKSGKA